MQNSKFSPFVDEVFVSVNSLQKSIPEYNKHNIIEDKIINIGPTGGIISAFMTQNNTD